MVYLYCVFDRSHENTDNINGILDLTVSFIEIDHHVFVAYSKIPEASAKLLPKNAEDTAIAALKHQAVIDKLFEIYTVLPFRLLTLLKDEQAIVTWAADKLNDLSVQLQKLKNLVEYSVILNFCGDNSPSGKKENSFHSDRPLSGREYMLAKQAKFKGQKLNEKQTENLRKSFLLPLSTVLQDSYTVTQNATCQLKEICLMTRENQKVFKEVVNKWVNAREENIHFMIVGPWPPYHFVNI